MDDRLAKLPRDPRGYIIPYIVLRDRDGTPNFTINDTRLRDKCLRERLCPVCGGKLYRGQWFLGGPGSAFHPDGAYIDTPMHFECMRYSATTCPYMISAKYNKEIGLRKTDRSKLPATVIFVDETIDPERPALFVAVMCLGLEVLPQPTFSPHVRPKRPYTRIEFWRRGVQLTEAEAMPLLSTGLRDHYREVANGMARRRIA